MEARWLPGWSFQWVFSVSGFAEAGAVFQTPSSPEGKCNTWVISHYEPPQCIQFVRWQVDELVVHIDLKLSDLQLGSGKQLSLLDIVYTYTACTDAAERVLDELHELGEQDWLTMMQHWENHLNQWLRRSPSELSPSHCTSP